MSAAADVAVNTKRVSNRRTLHFDSLDEILADAESLASATELQTLGNWSLGQILMHLAEAMVLSIDGMKYQAPWHMRIVGRLIKKRLLKKPMPAGFKLPAPVAKRVVPEPDISTQDGIDALHIAINRLKNESQRAPHPAFGKFTRDQYNQLHCRHAELHLSFAVPVDSQ